MNNKGLFDALFCIILTAVLLIGFFLVRPAALGQRFDTYAASSSEHSPVDESANEFDETDDDDTLSEVIRKVDRMYGTKDNLFDKNSPDIVKGKYISGISSNQPKWTSNSAQGETGYIPVSAGDKIAYLPTMDSVNTSSYYAMYDENMQIVKVTNKYNTNKYVLIPSDPAVKYIRFSFKLANIDEIMIIRLDSSDPLPVNAANYSYNIYGGYSLYETVPRVDALENAVMPIMPRVVETLGNENLFDKSDPEIVIGRYISSISGGSPKWTPNPAFAETGYISVNSGDKIACFSTNLDSVQSWYYAMFDENKNVVRVSSTYSSNRYITIPPSPEVKFIRFAYKHLYTDTLMVIRIDDADPLPISPSNYTYNKFGGYSLPELAQETHSNLAAAIEQLQAQIGASVSVGAQWYGKTCYCYGTSITSVHEGTGKYPTYLAQLSGMNVIEKGRGGGGIGNASGQWSSFSRGEVYASVCNITDGKTYADLIILETGANDIADDVPLGTIFDTGTDTLAGCLNDCIRYLQKNTNAQIAVMPSPSSTTSPQTKPKYYEWAEMIRQICDVNRVSYLSPNANLGQAKLTSDNGSLYVVDSIHQTELGGYILAEQMWYQIRNIPCFYTELPIG